MMNAQNFPEATILLVDDDQTNLDILSEYLEKYGFTTMMASSGTKAIELSRQMKPDLIMLDVMMPSMDGFATCMHLKAQDETKDIPVVFMTGLSEQEEKLKGFEVGGVDYIVKPFRLKEVIARVHAHATIRQQQKQLQEQNIQLQEQNALIEEQRKQLQALNVRKDKFLSIISRDLQHPFAGIFLATERIQKNIELQHYDEIKQLSEQLQTAVENYQALLENLMKWGQIQQGILEYHPQPVDLHLIIIKHLALFSPKAAQKQIALKSSIQERIMAFADVNMLDTVFQNLLSNALKFTEGGGSIEVVARCDESEIIVSVSDTGLGISEEDLRKVFRIDAKYQRVGTMEETGTGLGLILCQEFIKQHKGRIWLESEVKKGSTVTFTLPNTSTT